MIKVLIADDHKIVRQGLRMLFEMEEDIQVIGEARDGLEAQEMAAALGPDVILMDVNMPGADGIEATRRILRECPTASVLMLTMFREDEHVFEAIRAGARGYVLKDADSLEVVRAIRMVATGGSVIDPAVAGRVFSRFNSLTDTTVKGNSEELNGRELEILALIAEGASNREIGAKLFLAEKTIKNYVTSIFQKLQMNDRTQAAVYALQHGLIPKPAVSSRTL